MVSSDFGILPLALLEVRVVVASMFIFAKAKAPFSISRWAFIPNYTRNPGGNLHYLQINFLKWQRIKYSRLTDLANGFEKTPP